MALKSRDYETALLNFMEVLKPKPTRPDIRYKVGVVFLPTGQLDAAKQQFALVLMQQPEMAQAHGTLGMVHLEEKNYALAIEEFRLVLRPAADFSKPLQIDTRHDCSY